MNRRNLKIELVQKGASANLDEIKGLKGTLT